MRLFVYLLGIIGFTIIGFMVAIVAYGEVIEDPNHRISINGNEIQIIGTNEEHIKMKKEAQNARIKRDLERGRVEAQWRRDMALEGQKIAILGMLEKLGAPNTYISVRAGATSESNNTISTTSRGGNASVTN